jgi:tRNA(Met) C34 N-acetyltransferase TmcA
LIILILCFSYSNIYVTSPAAENLKILFEFILKGFNALDYQDHIDYDIQYSSNDHKEKLITQLTIHRPKQHRQVIQVYFNRSFNIEILISFSSIFNRMKHLVLVNVNY